MNVLQNNAYYVLGLDSSATQKDVSKRSKEILTRLKIDDVPEYDTDIKLADNFRTEEAVHRAVANLTTPKKHVKSYFFWFQTTDSVDDQAIGLLRKGDRQEALRVWEEHSAATGTKALMYKKNLALLYTLLLFTDNNKSYLAKSIGLWSELTQSDRFWNSFGKVYKLNDELGAESTVLEDFRHHVPEYLADIYTELRNQYKEDVFAASFAKNFGLTGKKLESDVLGPIYKVVNDSVEKIESLNVSADGLLDSAEKQVIKQQIEVLQTEFNKLTELNLYDNSQIKDLRDRAAAALRELSIDLENNLGQTDIALGLAKIASQISGAAGLKVQMTQDVQTLESNRRIKPVVEAIKAGNLSVALGLINQHLADKETDQEVRGFLQGLKDKITEKQNESSAASDVNWSGIAGWVFWIGLFALSYFLN